MPWRRVGAQGWVPSPGGNNPAADAVTRLQCAYD